MSDKERLLYTSWFGVFVVEDGEVIDKVLFDKDPIVLAEKRYSIKNNDVLDEEKELLNKHEDIKVTSERLKDYGDFIVISEQLVNPEEYSYSSDLLQETLIEVGKIEVKESIDIGEHLAKAVETIQDLNETINILMERMRDWYSLHFPELEDQISDEKYVELIEKYGSKEEIIEELNMENSVGGDITEKEKNNYISLANVIKSQIDYRSQLHEYVEDMMRTYAPNITALTGPKLGGELIEKAGSLKKIAMKPSSTIQVLGAEKSLFKHLEKGTKPPKHGLILQHPYVHKAPYDKRGKIARAFANKIAIAARLDYFSNKDKGDELRNELEEKIKKIKKA
ncbi:MAG: NOP5/NOP56 family protein [Thermoplasmatota archaeon]